MRDINENKHRFLSLLNSVEREGIDKLCEYLEKSDFFTAPASSKFHSNFVGGLLEHSLNVYDRFSKLIKTEYGENQEKVSKDSIIICSLLHDICKVDYYRTDYRNVKIDGNWVQKPFFAVEDSLPYGHGEKSVYIISGFLKLTREEAMIINWHMGGFDDRVKGGSYSLSKAFYDFPTALLFHIADIQATYLDEQCEQWIFFKII